ncbi:MAG: c-type cytochrome [Thermoanaerobaculia bacterium]|nr:c-type cytochrome [Thermoanaerobaculia bacterium]
MRTALSAVTTALVVTATAAGTQLADHTYGAEAIETGSRVYTRECALCHGTNGGDVEGVDLRSGRFLRPLSDDDIRAVVTTGIADAGMPAVKLRSDELEGLVAFIRAGFDPAGVAVRVGDAERGRALFEGRGECLSCHRVAGRGSRVAPDLTDIGAIRTPAMLQLSLLDPTATMRPIHRPLYAVTRDGRTIRGRRLNEDTYTVQLIDDQERLLSVAKADLVELELAETSPMPSMRGEMSAQELADLVAYLLSLRGLG